MAKPVRCRKCNEKLGESRLRCVKCGKWVSRLANLLLDQNKVWIGIGQALHAREWCTLDKRHLVVSEMETDHLINAIKYVARKCWSIRGEFIEALLGQKAWRQGNTPKEVDSILSAANKSTWEDFLPTMAFVMLTELSIREPPFTLKDLRDYMIEKLGCDWTGGAFS